MARVLNISTGFNPTGGTPAKLRALMKASTHEHYIYHPGYNDNKEGIMRELPFYSAIGVKAFAGIHNRNIIAHVIEISRIIKKYNIEIVHFYFNFEMLFVLLLKPLWPKVKFVRSYEGYIEVSRMRRFIISLCIPFIDYNIYISNYIKDRYEKLYNGLKKQKSSIIYNSPVYIQQINEQIERTKILYVGAMNKHKNVQLQIEVMNCVINKYHRNDIVLTIIGDGPDRSKIEELINKYNLGNNIVLMGIRKDVGKQLNTAKIYIHTATNEGFGISVVEAMFMKCPCMVANASALPELVDNSCGFILPIDNPDEWAKKLIYLTDNPEIAKKLGENAHNRANQLFSLDKFTSLHDKLYSSLTK